MENGIIKRTGDFCRKYWFRLSCGALVLIQFLVALRFMGRQYFSLDEVSQIGFIAKGNSFGRIIDYYLTSEVTNLPLWPLLAAFWYRMVPYGEGWMRLINVILTTIAIIFMIKAGKAWKSERTGLLMGLLACISSLIMIKCSLTFRVHAFWLLFTSLTLWLYIERLKEAGKESKRILILLSVSVTGLVWSHYFGVLTVIYLMGIDLILLIRKHIGKACFIPYIIGGGSLLPWFLLMLSKRTMVLSDFWPKTPTLESIAKALRYILSKNIPVYIIFLFAMLVAAFLLIESVFNGFKDFDDRFVRFAFAFMPLIFITLDYIYSAHINVRSGIFVYRYFLSVMPAAFLTTAVFTEECLDRLIDRLGLSQVFTYGVVVIFTAVYIGSGNFYYTVREEISAPYDNTYGNVRDEILSKEGNPDEKVMIAINANRANADGFEEYYFGYGRPGSSVHVVSNEDSDIRERMEKADRIYIYQVMEGTPDTFTELMGDDFKETSQNADISLYEYERTGK